MNPRSLIQHRFTCQYYFLFDFFFFFSFFLLLRCFMFHVRVRTVCFQQWQYYPHPQRVGYVSLVIENFYIYVSYFLYFFYGYLLHYVVYNTVVCINTIIYFSMGQKKRINGK